MIYITNISLRILRTDSPQNVDYRHLSADVKMSKLYKWGFLRITRGNPSAGSCIVAGPVQQCYHEPRTFVIMRGYHAGTGRKPTHRDESERKPSTLQTSGVPDGVGSVRRRHGTLPQWSVG